MWFQAAVCSFVAANVGSVAANPVLKSVLVTANVGSKCRCLQFEVILFAGRYMYRLTEEAITDATNGNRTSSYLYDAVGDRQSKSINGVTTTYTYDANSRLLNEKVNNAIAVEYKYDNNGNTTTKTENGIITTYNWNDEKRLIAATVGNTQQVEYTYNDQGIRVSAKMNGVETHYLLDEGIAANVWEEYAPNNAVQTAYVYGSALITQTQADQTSYYLVDGLGSTRLLTDAQGQVLNSYNYEAFGETVSQTGTASNKYQYAGEQLDATLGDYYLRQRFYDTSSGRFGRMDKYPSEIIVPSTLNKYLYAGANPVTGTDPSGYFTMTEQTATLLNLEQLSVTATVAKTADTTIQSARIIALFFGLLAVAATTYILTKEEMSEWTLDAQPKKGSKGENLYKLFPTDQKQRQEIDKDRQNANQMRVQAQTELQKDADLGIPLFATSQIGVTKAQVAAGLTSLWNLRGSIPFMRKGYIDAFQQSIALAWGDVQRSGPVAGARQQVSNREWDKNGNIVRKPTKGSNRVDVENLRGTNLRS